VGAGNLVQRDSFCDDRLDLALPKQLPDDLARRSTGRESEARRAPDLRGHPAHRSVVEKGVLLQPAVPAIGVGEGDLFEFVARKVHARHGHARRARYWMLPEGRKLSSSKHPQRSPSGG
jgi:hypothetical protein